MTEQESFMARAEVTSALDDLIDERLQLTEEGREEGELPTAEAFLRERDISIPEGVRVWIRRTVHDSGVAPTGAECDGVPCGRRQCRMINDSINCDWICTG